MSVNFAQHGNTAFTRDGLRRLARSYHMRPAILRKHLAEARRKRKQILRTGWDKRNAKPSTFTLSPALEARIAAATPAHDDRLASMPKQTFRQELCKHEDTGIFHDLIGHAAICNLCAAQGPYRKSVYGAKQALLKGLTK